MLSVSFYEMKEKERIERQITFYSSGHLQSWLFFLPWIMILVDEGTHLIKLPVWLLVSRRRYRKGNPTITGRTRQAGMR